MTQPPLQWYGGKGHMLKPLLSNMPSNIKCYVEVFGGSGSLLFAKRPSPIEVYNDVYDEVVNFYTVLRDKASFKKFQRLVELTPYSRKEFMRCSTALRKGGVVESGVKKAWMFFITNRMSVSGVGRGFSYTARTRCGINNWLSVIPKLDDIHRRLKPVIIENVSFEKLIVKYDTEQTFFYLDPPYVLSARKGKHYKHEMDDDQHLKLIDMLLNCKANWMLSGYDNHIYKKLDKASNVYKSKYERKIYIGPNSGMNNSRMEILWVKKNRNFLMDI
jgi:DNA adenine methylase